MSVFVVVVLSVFVVVALSVFVVVALSVVARGRCDNHDLCYKPVIS
jgi:hypothetical protein